MAPPPLCKKEHLAAEEVGCECSHKRCCKKWHSSHRKPLKMLQGPQAEHGWHLHGAAMQEGLQIEAVPACLTGVGKDKDGLLHLK